MDVKEYISSGILESVVLGFASEQERQEVSCMSHIYPEIQEEMTTIETSFEKMVFQTAIAPSAHLRAVILSAIAKEPQIPAEGKDARIVRMPANGPWKWVAAASVVMLLGVGALWYATNRRATDLTARIAAMKQDQDENEQIMSSMQVEQKRLTDIQSVIARASVTKVLMTGTGKDPGSLVSVLWNADSKKAVMVAETIAPPPSDMQYQLWAIAGGKPVSLGLFDYDEVMKMTEPFEVVADNISAFAITIEKRGGVASPTMENMIVMGPVTSS